MGNQQSIVCSIIECKKISSDVYLTTLEAPDQQKFNFQPGQYLFVELAKDDARPYSIASTPSSGNQLQMHIRDIPGNNFSGQVLDVLKNDQQISISLPAGQCTIDRSCGTRPLLFIAGGTGFAPVHSIIQSLIESNDSRSIILYWGANDEAEFYMRDKAEQWETEQKNITFVPVVNCLQNDQQGKQQEWSGESGLVHEAVFRNINQLSDYDIYLSGSSAMVFNIYRQLRDKNVPSQQIFSDMLDILREKGELDN